MNKLKRMRVKGGMVKMKMYTVTGSVVFMTVFSSCVQPLDNQQAASVPSIKHSDPEVHSLQDYQNVELLEKEKSEGVASKIFGAIFFGWLFGSDPDDHRRSNDRNSGKDRREFLRENRDTIVRDLESKKD